MQMKFVHAKEAAETAPADMPSTGLDTAMDVKGAASVKLGSPSMGAVKLAGKTQVAFQVESDAPPCPECGDIMVRSGACHKCVSCGTTSGCS
jgi:ribonucleoside-diphosphate reductase alpha chain